jgi:SAM-dependent methyltransferase
LESLTNPEWILCPTCEEDDAKPFIPFGPRDIVRCRRCGLVYVNPRRPLRSVNAYFENTYISNKSMLSREFGQWREETLKREVTLVKQIRTSGRRILDVGCAGGEFLSHFISDGWECSGVEPSQLAADQAQERGICVYRSVFQESKGLERESFDVITYLDALFFSATPRQDLEKAHDVLKSDGVLVIELPGMAYRLIRNVGPVSMLINHRWCHFSSVSPNLFYFSTSSLRAMLAKAGFEIKQIQLEQAPRRGVPILRFMNDLHLQTSRALFALTGGHVNLAAKVIYVCRKTG